MKTKTELATEYLAKIGYDPFEDDPTMTVEEVEDILREHDQISAACGADIPVLVHTNGAKQVWKVGTPVGDEFFVYGISKDPRVVYSLSMARELVA